MYAPDAPQPAAPPSGTAQQNSRYSYLAGRLRTRQITMEEATELFGLMQGMIRVSEQARIALQRSAIAAGAATSTETPAVAPRTPPMASGSSDDLFLVGLLAMGAGAGLMAAMAKRLQDLAPPTSGAQSR